MPKLTTNPQAESFYGVSPYIGMGNNPVLMVDPDGEFVLAAFIIGAIAGGFSGYKVAEAKGYDLGDLKGWAYMLGGAAIGGISGSLGAGVAAGGGAMANTTGIVMGSYSNSVGMALLSGGMIDPSLSIGGASYNFKTGEFGYLGKKGNSTLENVGYAFGALGNVSDILAGKEPGEVQLNTEKSDAIGHSSLTKVGETNPQNSIVSVGPDPGGLPKSEFLNPMKTHGATNDWKNYVDAGKNVNKIKVKGVNFERIVKYGAKLDKSVKYNTFFSSCSTHCARAMSISGVPTIGIHPFVVNAQIYLRSIGVRPIIYSHFLLNEN